jgi:antitoxin HicB
MRDLMQYEYPCVLAAENDGGFSVSFPDVPEALTCGNSRAEALALAEEALAVALGTYMKSRESVPSPSRATRHQELVAVPPIVAAKLALYME